MYAVSRRRLRWSHAVVREAWYSRLSRDERTAWHRRLAAMLESGETRPGERAGPPSAGCGRGRAEPSFRGGCLCDRSRRSRAALGFRQRGPLVSPDAADAGTTTPRGRRFTSRSVGSPTRMVRSARRWSMPRSRRITRSGLVAPTSSLRLRLLSKASAAWPWSLFWPSASALDQPSARRSRRDTRESLPNRRGCWPMR